MKNNVVYDHLKIIISILPFEEWKETVWLCVFFQGNAILSEDIPINHLDQQIHNIISLLFFN